MKRKLNIPMPRNAPEFALLTKWYFGKELHLKFLDINAPNGGEIFSGRYEIAEKYNDYHGIGWNFSEHSIEGYDYSSRFYKRVFGWLTCGGIGESSYGQFNAKGHRHYKRLVSLQNSLRGKDANYVRPSLVRLAAQSRARREQNDSR